MRNQPAATPKREKAYKAPQLLVYGAVENLTTGGSMGDMETNMTCMGMNLKRQVC
jgi:hypothetical protein